MKDTTSSNRCPKCGGPIPAEASQGICPKCALAAVATPTEAGQPAGERPPPPSLEAVATAFPQLEILELIGAGGMGAVYQARQPKLDRLVALKLLTQPLAADGAFAERFHREARVLARLNHPGIVSVHDYGEAGGFFYLLMEFVDGVNLRQAMHAGRFTPAQALALVPKICEALQFAHDEGILHRDIKPENILLDTRGRVKIADFGIAKLIGDKGKDAALTGSGLAVGTPHYMAPEQLEHPQDVDQRADIYSLGVVFYEMLTGELPIGRFAPPSQKTPMDPRVDEVVLRALERERERRQHNVTEVRTEVEQITATPAGQPSAPLPAAATAKTSLCYVSTPEYMRTFWGRFIYIYQGNGELRLNDRTLSFTSGWQSVTIPLASICSLALGEYSLVAKPIPLNFLEVTFDERGVPRTLLFTPTRSGFLPVWETNKIVAEWSSALQEAVRAATGRTLALNRSSAKGRSHGELLKTFVLTAVLCSLAFAIIPLIAAQRLPNHWTDFVWGPIVAALTVGMLLSLRAWRERVALRKKNLDELTRLPGSSVPAATGPSGTVVLPALEADSSAPKTSPTGLAGAARVATCYFSTPERMRNCFPGPQAHIFQCKGELRLEAAELVFISPWQTRVVIPLKDIRDLSIGQFQMWTTPWVMKYERLNFLSVAFGAEGERRTVHLTPVLPGTTSTAQADAQVAEWREEIRAAAVALTGAAPRTSEPATVSISAQPGWNRKGVPLFAAFLLTWVLLLWRLPKLAGPAPDALTIVVFVAMLLLLGACCWYGLGFLQANRALNRGDFDAVTCDEPPPAASDSGRPA
jgi:serine/threonine protein kinase